MEFAVQMTSEDCEKEVRESLNLKGITCIIAWLVYICAWCHCPTFDVACFIILQKYTRVECCRYCCKMIIS